jgi:hypothetical protein
MRNFLMILVLLALGAGCGGTGTTASGIDMATATCVKNTLTDAQGCYTSQGVYAELGTNPCMDVSKHPECKGSPSTCCWNPISDECYPSDGTTQVSCESQPIFCEYPETCKSLDPVANPYGAMTCGSGAQFSYQGNSSGGMVCLPYCDSNKC